MVFLTTGVVEFINLWMFSARPTVAILVNITIYIIAETKFDIEINNELLSCN
jgi:hypothetical protein